MTSASHPDGVTETGSALSPQITKNMYGTTALKALDAGQGSPSEGKHEVSPSDPAYDLDEGSRPWWGKEEPRLTDS